MGALTGWGCWGVRVCGPADGDLQFEEGDTIVLLDLSDEEWGRGYVENKPEDVGDFPRSFIDITGAPFSSPGPPAAAAYHAPHAPWT
jgi:hypothetical protein